jgi:hypothetical protein
MEYKIVKNADELNCTNCLNASDVVDGHMCFYSHDLDKRQFVDENDFCQEFGLWLINDKPGETNIYMHAGAVHFFSINRNVGVTHENS